jgi:hypothetical protein
MRTLVVFIDMLNTEYLITYNKKRLQTPLDDFFYSFKGTTFTNIFTPGPDTGRSLASFWSGVPPYLNGCDKRGKYPKFFLTVPTFFDFLKDSKVVLKILSERKNIFPPTIQKNEYFTSSLDLIRKPAESQLSFIDILDSHHVLDDVGYSQKGIKLANIQTRNSLDFLFSNIDKEDYDTIIFFSDHGHILSKEVKKGINALNFLDSSRSRILLHIWNKKDKSHLINDVFGSITDIHDFIIRIYQNNKPSTLQTINSIVFEPKNPEYILIEDNLSISSIVYASNNIWNLRTAKEDNVILITDNFSMIEEYKKLSLKYDLRLIHPNIHEMAFENHQYYLQKLNQNDELEIKKKIYWYYFDSKKRYNYFIRSIGHLIIPKKLKSAKSVQIIYNLFKKAIH